MGRDRCLQADSNRCFDAAVKAGKLAFRRMRCEKADFGRQVGHGADQFVIIGKGVYRIPREIQLHSVNLENISEMRHVRRCDVCLRVACGRFGKYGGRHDPIKFERVAGADHIRPITTNIRVTHNLLNALGRSNIPDVFPRTLNASDCARMRVVVMGMGQKDKPGGQYRDIDGWAAMDKLLCGAIQREIWVDQQRGPNCILQCK